MARGQDKLGIGKGKVTPEEALAEILRERRKELNLTQVGLADELLDQSYISKLERGAREIGIRSFIILAQKLDMTPGELMDAVVKRMG